MGSKLSLKTICLMFVVIIEMGGIYALADEDMDTVSKRERALYLDSEILDGSYALFSVQELRMPLAKHAYLVAKKAEDVYKIRTAAEFSLLVKAIQTRDEALELARLLSSQELRSFLQDVFYAEVHKKVEVESRDEIVEPWFKLDTEKYEELKLSAPLVTEKEGIFKIERFVASYPRAKEGRESILPAQLLKIRETIDSEGHYSMEIQDILAEGEQIHKILLFTK